jgi:hypothetical protein
VFIVITQFLPPKKTKRKKISKKKKFLSQNFLIKYAVEKERRKIKKQKKW